MYRKAEQLFSFRQCKDIVVHLMYAFENYVHIIEIMLLLKSIFNFNKWVLTQYCAAKIPFDICLRNGGNLGGNVTVSQNRSLSFPAVSTDMKCIMNIKP